MKYDINHIKSLLDAYYRGETSPNQEKLLAAFFTHDDTFIPADMIPDRDMFRALSQASVPADLEPSLNQLIDSRVNQRVSPLRRWVRLVATAAVVALLAGGIISFIGTSSPLQQSDTESAESYAHITGDMLSPSQVENQATNAIALLYRTFSLANPETIESL